MEALNLKTYLLYAIYIVRTHPLVLFCVAALGLFNGVMVYLPQNALSQLISGITILSAIFINPVIYGIYYEIVEERSNSVLTIFRTYVGGYLLLLFCLYIPILITTAVVVSSAGAEGSTAAVMVIMLIFSLLFIYVVPAYYVSGKIVESITFGVRFFFRHTLASAPLLLMALTSELLLLLSHFKLRALQEQSPPLFIFLDFSLFMVASVIDYLLFIILLYILRRQNIDKR